MDLPERLVMTPGQTFRVELPGLGGAGYLWFAEVSAASPDPGTETFPPTDATDQTVAGAAIERDAQQSSSADERTRVGASLPETLLITAHALGTATVHVVQRRPWESGQPWAERHTQVVVVPGESDTAETLDESPPSEDTRQERGH